MQLNERTRISHKSLISSIVIGLIFAALVHVFDYFLAKFFTEKGSFFYTDGNGFIMRIILFFLAMSFVLLLKVLNTTQQLCECNTRHFEHQKIFELFGFCVVVCGVEKKGSRFIIEDINSIAETVEKVKKEDLIGKEVREVFPEIEKLGLIEVMRRVYLTGEPEAKELLKNKEDQSVIWRKNFIYKRGDDKIVYIYQNLADKLEISDRLKRKEFQFNSIIKNFPMFYVCINKNGTILEIDGCVLKSFGIDPAEVLGKNFYQLFKPDERFYEAINSAFEGLVFTIKLEMLGKVFEMRFQRLLQDDMNSIFLVGYDVTGLVSMEKDKERLFTAINQADEVVVITDPNGIVEYVNPVFERISGYAIEEVLGKPIGMIKSGLHDKVFYKNLWDTIRAGKVWQGHFYNKKKDGTIYEEEAVISPVKNKKGEIINYVAVKKDVTREAELQKQLIHAQKMEAIGRLAGGVAHDFNNILTAVLGYCDLALSQMTEEDKAMGALKEIKAAGKRAAQLTKQLLAFSRKQILNMQEISVQEVIKEMDSMIRRIIGDRVNLTFLLPTEDLLIYADKSQVEQVIMNLILNANDALSESDGIIEVLVGKHMQRVPYEHSGFYAEPGEYARISIRDNGCGMTDEVKLKIFEPFFTTKPNGKGTGLGLSTVFGIVKQHGGFIAFESEAGKGTTFHVYMPLLKSSQGGKLQEVSRLKDNRLDLSEKFKLSGAILLAEDDKALQMFVASVLQREGFRVFVASDGLEARQILITKAELIKFAIVDLVMPFFDGGKLAEYIINSRPDVKIMLMSGYADVILSDKLKSRNLPFLNKPFSQEELINMIKDYFCEKKEVANPS